MIEIIPNWHPVLVHFTLGLLTVSAVLYAATLFTRSQSLLIVARWNLWIGVLITLGTVAAGLYAYNTVSHSTAAQHEAMENHEHWALITASLFIVMAGWAAIRVKRKGADTPPSVFFVVLMLVGAGMLAVTGYKGGELVYRHGIGVIPVQTQEASSQSNTTPESPSEQEDGQTHDHSGHTH